MSLTVSLPDANAPASAWADRITACWRVSVQAIMEVGRLLDAAKQSLPHGAFGKMIATDLPFGSRTAQMLMAIAADPRLSNPKHVSHLPPSYGTLYELTKLDDAKFEAAIEQKIIRPDMERREVAQVVKREARATREHSLAEKQTALPIRKYCVIVADPEWRFEPWSRSTGMDRAADNHYPTSCLDVIKSRDVASIAAKDCVLFLWATAPMLPHALAVMEAWGFDYRSNYVWSKDRIGTGYWNRNAHEHLLIGAKGDIPAPAPGTQRPSVIEGHVTKHSAKPDVFLEMIEEYFPTLPKIELNRRGPPRPGWDAWGNETLPPHDPETGEITESGVVPSTAPPEPACADPHPPAPQAHAGLPPDDCLDLPEFLKRNADGAFRSPLA